PAVHHFVQVDLQAAVNLGAKTEPYIIFSRDDARACMAQTLCHLTGIVADGGNNAEAGYDHSSHKDLDRKSGGSRDRATLGQGSGRVGEEADLQALDLIDHFVIHLHDAVGDAHHQLAHDHALQIDD